jgi:tRNA-specific 2-thiouridylase
MSGGVDSSVAALLLARQRREVVGVTMKNWCYGESDGWGRSCCSLESIESARRVATALGFAHYVVDFEAPFAHHVIRPFIDDYLAGRTPNPCVACNAKVRFPGLANRAKAFGCDAFATGHYARVDRSGPSPRIRRAADASKDQSYALWAVPPETLARLELPLGGLHKTAVRTLAAEAGLSTAERPDSQEICFVPGGDYGEFLEQQVADAGVLAPTLGPGDIVTRGGTRVGTHRGVARYTVGQRRGLGVAGSDPVYVTGLDAGANRVVVGAAADLLTDQARLRDVRWPVEGDEARVLVQLRSRHRAAPARVRRIGAGEARIRFDEPQRAVTPGQSAVFYDGETVVGGGIVADASPAETRG